MSIRIKPLLFSYFFSPIAHDMTDIILDKRSSTNFDKRRFGGEGLFHLFNQLSTFTDIRYPAQSSFLPKPFLFLQWHSHCTQLASPLFVSVRLPRYRFSLCLWSYHDVTDLPVSSGLSIPLSFCSLSSLRAKGGAVGLRADGSTN